MKKTTKLFGLFAVAAMTVIGCAKEIDAPKEEVINEPEEKVVDTHTVTISAGALETKTVINEGVSSASFKWSADDASRFHIWENSEEGSDIALETSDEYATVKLTATFATKSAASYTYSAFLAKNVKGTDPKIPAEQTCTSTSYDPNADILVALPVTNEGSVLSKLDMRFGRPCVINKMTLKGLTEGETVSSVEIYADKPLTGYYDIAGKSWTGESQKITLTTSQVVPASGQVVVYFVTMPVEGATLTVTAITDAHVYNKTFGSTINFVMDQVTKFGVSSLGMFKYRDVITQSLTGLSTSGSGYDNWSGKSYSGTRHSSAVYAGNTNQGVSYIQVRGKSDSGIISTTSGGAVKRVFVAYTASQNPQDGRTTTVLGKNIAYSATSDLYSGETETKGEEVGTFTYHTGDRVSYINASSDYDYIALLPNGAIYFDEIDIFWDDAKSDPGIKWTADGNAGVAVTAASAALKTGSDDMPEAALYNPNSVSVSYSSTDEDVAEINSSTGFITLKAAGETTIKATFAGDASYKALTVSYTLTVTNDRSKVATPSFSPAGSAVEANSTVRISSNTPNAIIYYKAGSAPTTSVYDGYSTLVDGSDKPYIDITIDVAKTVYAIAVKDDWNDSDSNSATYAIAGLATPLNAPTGVSVTSITPTSFTSIWTAPDGGAPLGYTWKLSTSADSSIDGISGGSGTIPSGATLTITVDSGIALADGQDYYFHIKSTGNGVTYAESAFASTTAIKYIKYDFTVVGNYPSGFPTKTGTNTTTATAFTVGGHTFTLYAPDAYYMMTNSDSKTLFFGKTSSTFTSSAYLEIPGIAERYISNISVVNASNAAKDVSVNIYTSSGTAKSTAVKTVAGGTMNFSISDTTPNVSYKISSTTNNKNLNFASIIVNYK